MAPRDGKGPRLFVEAVPGRGAIESNSTISLSPADSHYLRDVLRLAVGSPLEVGDRENSTVFKASVASSSEAVTLSILEQLPDAPRTVSLSLLFALCKGQKNEQVCDWATELGCSDIIFWQAERSVVRVRSAEDVEAKEIRLSKVALAAAQQSKQRSPPRVSVATSLSEALSLVPTATVKICCSLEEDAAPIGTVCSDLRPGDHGAIVIGPEGDLTPEELEILKSNGYLAASLGPNVLRSELAAVAAILAANTSAPESH